MQDHTLRVGEELVIGGHVRLTILGVEQGKVIFGITAEPNDVRPSSLAALCDTPVILQKETIND
jgi:hypothetical protein